LYSVWHIHQHLLNGYSLKKTNQRTVCIKKEKYFKN
jgi:hypothetical protein